MTDYSLLHASKAGQVRSVPMSSTIYFSGNCLLPFIDDIPGPVRPTKRDRL